VKLMIAKLSALGFTVVTAMAGTAAAHENCNDASHAPASYNAPGYQAPGYQAPGYQTAGSYTHRPAPAPRVNPAEYSGRGADLRQSDFNHDGWVTLAEALDSARQDFHRSDRDRNRVLTRRELSRGELAREDRNRDGRVTYYEHEGAVRASFASLDANRDGFLGRYEVARYDVPVGRGTGWRR
jgi:hypothetical protein